MYSVFLNLCIKKKAPSAECSLSLIQFVVQQVLGYAFVPVTRACRASAVLVKVKMADGSDEKPSYVYS